MLCQAYDSDPSNPAVLNLLAHHCLTRKDFPKVSPAVLCNCNMQHVEDAAVRQHYSDFLLAEGQAAGVQGTELSHRQTEQRTECTVHS